METPEELVRKFTIYPEEESIQQRIERIVTNGSGYVNTSDSSENKSSLLDLIIHLGKLATKDERRERLLQKEYTPSKKMLELQELIDFRNKLGLRVLNYNTRRALYREFYRQANIDKDIPSGYKLMRVSEKKL